MSGSGKLRIERGKLKDQIKQRGWDVALPAKARAKLTQSVEQDFPERYEHLLELYYKKLAKKKE